MADRSGCCSSGSPPARVVKLTNTQSIQATAPENVTNTPKTVRLGVLDHVSAPLLIVKMPFIFSQTLDSTLLTTSLATMLGRYPLFSGRLIIDSEGDYSVTLNNAGGSLTMAKCNTTTLADLLPEGMVLAASKNSTSAAGAQGCSVTGVPASSYTPEDLTPFLPKVPTLILGFRNKDVALFHAQVTYLKDGGTVLGIAVPHVLADQETCRLLLKCWAEEYTTLDVGKIGGDIMRDIISREEQPKEQSFDIQVDGFNKNNTAQNNNNNLVNATESIPISSASMTTKTTTTRSEISGNMLGHALESRAVPALPQGWKSSRFQKRNWKYIPVVLGAGMGHTALAGMPATVAYYVNATRLGELKAEASKQIKQIAAADAAGKTKNDAASSDNNNKSNPWISTNDALVARLRQVLAQSLPGKAGKKELQLVIDLRKRMEPALPAETLGNCSWTVAVGSDTTTTTTDEDNDLPTLGALAAEIRAAVLELSNTNSNSNTATDTSKNKSVKNINNDDIRNELRWLVNNTCPGGAKMPVVFQNFSDMVKISGPILVSHWDWGGAEYKDLSFGGGPECTPVWHQPTFPNLPNCVFIVPAPCGGALVHLTLHKKLAKKVKANCHAL